METWENIYSDSTEAPKNGRRSDGGVYLVVADETEEFPVALRYAARLADASRGHVAILYVMALQEFQHWGNIEQRMRAELREQAEKLVWNVAKNINDINGQVPAIYLEEGDLHSVLIDVINRDTEIKMLLLAGTTGNSGPGPLVSYFTGKGLGKLRVPVAIVPSHLEAQAIDAIT